MAGRSARQLAAALAIACLALRAEASSRRRGTTPAPTPGIAPFKVTKSRLVKANFECKSNDRFIGKINSPEKCGILAGEKGADYFSYGKTSKDTEGKGLAHTATKAQNCYVEYTRSDNCTEGWENEGVYDFYAIDHFWAYPVKISSNKECKSKDKYLGHIKSVQDCAKAAMNEVDGQFFIYGKGLNTGKCYLEKTALHTCPEGFKSASGFAGYDFWGLQLTLRRKAGDKYKKGSGSDTVLSTKLKSGVECGSHDEYVGWYTTVDKCRAAVIESGGKYFSYGQSYSSRTWLCYMEKTKDQTCPEGLKENSFDFYAVDDDAAHMPIETTAAPTVPGATTAPTPAPVAAPTPTVAPTAAAIQQ